MCCVFLSKPHHSSPFSNIYWRSFASHSVILHLKLQTASLSKTFSLPFSLRMRNPGSLKQEFFKKWIVGLRKCRFFRRNMNIVERKKAIKLSADIAMASAKKQTTRWSRAIIANASKEDSNKLLMKQMLGSASSPPSRIEGQLLNNGSLISHKRDRSQKMLRRSRCGSRIKRSRSKKIMATSIAKRVVQKRTKVLKSLVPGGESMDDISLIEETLDYITSLKAQVDVMRCLASTSELLNHK